MGNYFKDDKVICNFENACRNKSKGFCRVCTKNFNIKFRDWFEPTEEHKKLVNMIKKY